MMPAMIEMIKSKMDGMMEFQMKIADMTRNAEPTWMNCCHDTAVHLIWSWMVEIEAQI